MDMRAATLFLCLSLPACTQFPALEGTISPELANADYPALVPTETLTREPVTADARRAETESAVNARAAALRARANAMNSGSIVDSTTKTRLKKTSG